MEGTGIKVETNIADETLTRISRRIIKTPAGAGAFFT